MGKEGHENLLYNIDTFLRVNNISENVFREFLNINEDDYIEIKESRKGYSYDEVSSFSRIVDIELPRLLNERINEKEFKINIHVDCDKYVLQGLEMIGKIAWHLKMIDSLYERNINYFN